MPKLKTLIILFAMIFSICPVSNAKDITPMQDTATRINYAGEYQYYRCKRCGDRKILMSRGYRAEPLVVRGPQSSYCKDPKTLKLWKEHLWRWVN